MRGEYFRRRTHAGAREVKSVKGARFEMTSWREVIQLVLASRLVVMVF